MVPIGTIGKARKAASHARYIGPDSFKSKGKAAAFHVIWRTLDILILCG
jgi:hypothetical protein